MKYFLLIAGLVVAGVAQGAERSEEMRALVCHVSGDRGTESVFTVREGDLFNPGRFRYKECASLGGTTTYSEEVFANGMDRDRIDFNYGTGELGWSLERGAGGSLFIGRQFSGHQWTGGRATCREYFDSYEYCR